MTVVVDDQTAALLSGSEVRSSQVEDFDDIFVELDAQIEQVRKLREGYRSCFAELASAVVERRALESAHERTVIRKRIEALGLPEADAQDLAFQLLDRPAP